MVKYKIKYKIYMYYILNMYLLHIITVKMISVL